MLRVLVREGRKVGMESVERNQGFGSEQGAKEWSLHTAQTGVSEGDQETRP